MSIIAETSATQIPAGTWSIDPVWSSLEFEVRKLGLIPIKGRVPGFAGTIEGGDDPSVVGTVDATSITTFDETRDGHLQSPDFFDTERFPEITFNSTLVRAENNELIVDGELTIKGTTRPIEARGTITEPAVTFGDVEKIGIELEAIVDRTEYGLSWNAPLPKGGFALANDVKLIVNLELARA